MAGEKIWTLAEVQKKLDRILVLALRKEPQHVTDGGRHGVILSGAEYRRPLAKDAGKKG